MRVPLGERLKRIEARLDALEKGKKACTSKPKSKSSSSKKK